MMLSTLLIPCFLFNLVDSCVLPLSQVTRYKLILTQQTTVFSHCCSKMSFLHGEAADLLQGLQQARFVFSLSPLMVIALCIICRR